MRADMSLRQHEARLVVCLPGLVSSLGTWSMLLLCRPWPSSTKCSPGLPAHVSSRAAPDGPSRLASTGGKRPRCACELCQVIRFGAGMRVVWLRSDSSPHVSWRVHAHVGLRGLLLQLVSCVLRTASCCRSLPSSFSRWCLVPCGTVVLACRA